MDRLIDYIRVLYKHDNIELSFKLEYSLYYGYEIKVIRKGYDIPIVESTGNNLELVIVNTLLLLDDKLGIDKYCKL